MCGIENAMTNAIATMGRTVKHGPTRRAGHGAAAWEAIRARLKPVSGSRMPASTLAARAVKSHAGRNTRAGMRPKANSAQQTTSATSMTASADARPLPRAQASTAAKSATIRPSKRSDEKM